MASLRTRIATSVIVAAAVSLGSVALLSPASAASEGVPEEALKVRELATAAIKAMDVRTSFEETLKAATLASVTSEFSRVPVKPEDTVPSLSLSETPPDDAPPVREIPVTESTIPQGPPTREVAPQVLPPDTTPLSESRQPALASAKIESVLLSEGAVPAAPEDSATVLPFSAEISSDLDAPPVREVPESPTVLPGLSDPNPPDTSQSGAPARGVVSIDDIRTSASIAASQENTAFLELAMKVEEVTSAGFDPMEVVLVWNTTSRDRLRVLFTGLQYFGTPYMGYAGPPTEFDCSGLTLNAWSVVGVDLPHWSAAQQSVSVPADRNVLRPADMIFYEGGPTAGGPLNIGHVGLVFSIGMTLESSPSKGVWVRPFFQKETIVAYGAPAGF